MDGVEKVSLAAIICLTSMSICALMMGRDGWLFGSIVTAICSLQEILIRRKKRR